MKHSQSIFSPKRATFNHSCIIGGYNWNCEHCLSLPWGLYAFKAFTTNPRLIHKGSLVTNSPVPLSNGFLYPKNLSNVLQSMNGL